MNIERKNTMRFFAILLAVMIGITFTFTMPEEVAAASKKPAKVVNVKVASTDYNALKITWKKAKNAKKYQVYRATSKNGKYKKVKTTTARSYTNKKLTTGKKYYYKVRAINGSKAGSFSSKKAGTPKLKKTTGVKAAAKSFNSAKLTWKKVNGAKGYQIYRATSKNGKYKKIKTTKSLSYTNSGLTVGKTYYYKVRAYRVVSKKNKYGSFSSAVSVKTNLDSLRKDMLSKVNAQRKKAGLDALKLSSALNKTAQTKAKDMYKNGDLSHTSPTLGDLSDLLDGANIDYTMAGENIAYGYSSVSSVMTGWMNSPGHKANILGNEYTHLGVGYYNGYWVQQFVRTPKTIPCPECGSTVNADQYHYTSTDAEGNTYGIYQCTNCYYLIEKCPKCENGYFEDAGITTTGTVSRKCSQCGNKQNASCIEKCSSCSSKVLGNTTNVSYKITFDSTKTYDGTNYDRTDGCYFQQFLIDSDVCKKCGKYVRTNPGSASSYGEFYGKLKTTLGSEENIYEYIIWEKQVGSEYQQITTPQITNLNKMTGTGEYK